MSKKWFVVHAYSGFEKSVQRALTERIARSGLADQFGQILVPVEEVVEMKSGQKAISDLMSSVVDPTRGTVEVLGKPVPTSRPGCMATAGVGVIPEDRHVSGCVLDMSVAENLVIGELDSVSAGHFVSRRRLHEVAGRLVREFDVVTSSLDAAMGSDAEYRALRDRTWTRVQALFSYFEGKYDYQHLPRDNATTIWILGQLGMTHKDRGAVRLLEDYLAHSAIEDVRARTADALWLIGDRSSVPALLAALGDPSLKVKGYAASGLGDLGDVSAVDPLLALFATLPDNKEETKARIADALGKLGDRRAAPAIKASLDVIRDPAYVRWARPALDRLTR